MLADESSSEADNGKDGNLRLQTADGVARSWGFLGEGFIMLVQISSAPAAFQPLLVKATKTVD